MKKLPKETIKTLNKEARQWEKEIAEEKPEQTARLLEEAEPFVAHREDLPRKIKRLIHPTRGCHSLCALRVFAVNPFFPVCASLRLDYSWLRLRFEKLPI